MGFHPANLVLRFVLELACLGSFVLWGGWGIGGGVGWLVGAGLAAVAIVVWATFAVPDDRSRSARPPVPVPGWVRLVIEVAFFGGGIAALAAVDRWALAEVLGGLVILHHLLSVDRLAWLVRA